MLLATNITTVGFKEAEKALSSFPKAFPRAATNAINRGLKSGQTLAARTINQNYNMGVGQAKGKIAIKKASYDKLAGALDCKGTMLPLHEFHPSVLMRRARVPGQRRGTGPYRQLVRVNIVRGPKKLVPGAFQIPDGRIMERRQQEKYPIYPVSGIGVTHMLGALRVGDPVSKQVAEMTQKRLNEQVASLLRGGGVYA
jgi:hypothetical protein